ncbi:PEPxxWA-CTERM sorting domain-containing protein [Phenylobacterium sp.]|jgi:hypothetical protein|uniref:PEPxxWA-CTERM sorting domain-containing protein n=1 Tax=Phenylobacterium sp. TaxID=1871053 RepID=UPI002F418ABF
MRNWKLAAGTAAVVMAVAAIGAGSARADPIRLNLTGAVADYTVIPGFNNGADHVDPSFLPLSGVDPNGVAVSQDDTFQVNVTLDAPLTIPGSVTRTDVVLILNGANFPDIDTKIDDAVVDFSDGGVAGLHFDSFSSSTHGQLSVFTPIFPPDNGPLTFDTITYSFHVSDLSQPATLNGAELDFSLLSPAPAPEPAAWALMLVGFGGLGATLRARRQSKVLA